MSYTLCWKHDGVIVNCEGTLTVVEVIRYNSEISEDSRFPSLVWEIVDYTNITGVVAVDFDAKYVGHTDLANSRYNRNLKIAVVTTNNRLIDLVNMYSRVLETTDWQVEIFETMDEAESWCEIE